jgi:hypothetical protein
MSTTSWSELDDQILIEMKKEGTTHGVISLRLGRSRGSISSRAKRLGLSDPANNPNKPGVKLRIVPKPDTPVPARVPDPEPAPVVEEVAAEDESILFGDRLSGATGEGEGVGLLDLKRQQCRWPLWNDDEPSSFRFCGCGVVPGSSYCKVHRKRTLRPRKEEERPLETNQEKKCIPLWLKGRPIGEIATAVGARSSRVAAHMKKLGLRYGGSNG